MKDELEVFDRTQSAPLPYYSGLCKALGGSVRSLIVSYLEIHHTSPPSDSQATTGRSSAPVIVGVDQMCEALGINRRTLHVALYTLAVWWKLEELRSSASRSGREFLAPEHKVHGKVKPYSIVGTRQVIKDQTLTIRRNYGRISQILTQAGIDAWDTSPQQVLNNALSKDDNSASTSSAPDLTAIIAESLRIRVRNGWTEERKVAMSVKMKASWEMRKKSGEACK